MLFRRQNLVLLWKCDVLCVNGALCKRRLNRTLPLLQGVPTHDAEGKELTKSQLKKLTKLWEAQRKKYDDWLSKSGGGATGAASEGAASGGAAGGATPSGQ